MFSPKARHVGYEVDIPALGQVVSNLCPLSLVISPALDANLIIIQ